MPVKDLIGNKYGRLTVVSLAPRSNSGLTRWGCVCNCGTEVCVVGADLKRGHTESCGCLKRENQALPKVHGKAGTKGYHVWASIKDRVFNPKCKAYPSYGGRGITMHPEWAKDFVKFEAYMGQKPSPAHTVERIDNSKGYEPGNVKWALPAEQNRNQRSNRYISFNGTTKLLVEWAEDLNMSMSTLHGRLRRWPLEMALTTPIRNQPKPKTTKEYASVITQPA